MLLEAYRSMHLWAVQNRHKRDKMRRMQWAADADVAGKRMKQRIRYCSEEPQKLGCNRKLRQKKQTPADVAGTDTSAVM